MSSVPGSAWETAPTRADPDSRARTHLANERTFLAWLRTGLSLVAVGLAAAGLLPGDLVPGLPYVRIFSILLVLCGILLMISGAARFVTALREIETGSFRSASRGIIAVALLVSLLAIMAIPLVFLLR